MPNDTFNARRKIVPETTTATTASGNSAMVRVATGGWLRALAQCSTRTWVFDQCDLGMLDSRRFLAFWLDADKVVAAMNVNIWDATAELQRLIRSGERIDRTALADPDIPLAGMIKD